MNDYRNTSVSLASAGSRRSARRGGSPSRYGAEPAAATAGGSAPLASRRRPAGRAYAGMADDRDPRRGGRAESGRGRRARRGEPVPTGGRAGSAAGSGSSTRRRSTNFMKYAADNRVVQAIHAFVTGPTRPLFIAIVIAAVVLGLYFPIRDCYTAWRTGDILTRQLEARNAYNEGLQADVDKYLSQEGIEEAARSELGMVLPGETKIELTGQDDAASDDGSDTDGSVGASDAGEDGAQQDSDAGDADANGSVPSTSAEAEAAEAAIAEDTPWYLQVLDGIFFYGGVEGQTVVSTGGK